MSDTSVSALHYVCNIAEKCQHRGGYTLDEAVELHKCVKNIRTHYEKDNFEWKTVMEDNTHHVHMNVSYVFEMLEKSQCQGVLNLEEAWTIYNALLLLFTKKSNTNTVDATKHTKK